MEHWKSKPKRYPHFSLPLSVSRTNALVFSPEAVASHAFYPFVAYDRKWRRFNKDGTRKRKIRPIKFASSTDADIFSYYRHILSERYEEELKTRGISDCVSAYRKIPVKVGKLSGKCNIHFANDVFLLIAEMQNCCAIALDIKSFFESIDHNRLKTVWCNLLGESRLPDDHYAVFKQLNSPTNNQT